MQSGRWLGTVGLADRVHLDVQPPGDPSAKLVQVAFGLGAWPVDQAAMLVVPLHGWASFPRRVGLWSSPAPGDRCHRAMPGGGGNCRGERSWPLDRVAAEGGSGANLFRRRRLRPEGPGMAAHLSRDRPGRLGAGAQPAAKRVGRSAPARQLPGGRRVPGGSRRPRRWLGLADDPDPDRAAAAATLAA